MRINTAKRLLRDGKPAIGTWLSYSSVEVAEALSHVGWDWIVVDTEHGAMNMETAQHMFIAIGTTDTIPMCRVAWNDPMLIKRVLDAGAFGVVIPMVNSAEDAMRAVRACRYPPVGDRSAGGGRTRVWAGADYQLHANDEILVVVQIEHIEAVKRAEEILSVPGVDACFIGPNDLAFSMGLSPRGNGPADPAHAEAVAQVLAAAKKCGVPAGYHCMTVDDVNRRLEQGFQFIACLNDSRFLLSAANDAYSRINREAAAEIR